jgi:dTDP-4-amino-4,6-dideoxygalactose transaminase
MKNRNVPFLDLPAMNREVEDVIIERSAELLAAGQFVGGPTVERFEREWAEYCGTRHAVGVGNGTDALVLALRALGIGRGDEVVVPTLTFAATAEAVVHTGATPRFADVDDRTLLLTPHSLKEAITPRTRAVIVVHLYGQPADMDGLRSVADHAGLLLVEDAAQAHGATWRGRRVGSFGDAGCFSFYPAKNLGAFGDAGAVVTNDPDLAQRVRSLGDHGRASGSHHQHIAVGTTSRLDAVQAVVLSAKLPRLDAWIAQRRGLAAAYRRRLAGAPIRLVTEAPLAQAVYHLGVGRVPRRDRVREALGLRGIATGVHYPTPCHLMPPYRIFAQRALPVAEQAAREVLSLPLFPHMTDGQVERVATALHEVLGEQVRADVA